MHASVFAWGSGDKERGRGTLVPTSFMRYTLWMIGTSSNVDIIIYEFEVICKGLLVNCWNYLVHMFNFVIPQSYPCWWFTYPCIASPAVTELLVLLSPHPSGG